MRILPAAASFVVDLFSISEPLFEPTETFPVFRYYGQKSIEIHIRHHRDRTAHVRRSNNTSMANCFASESPYFETEKHLRFPLYKPIHCNTRK